MAAPVSDRVVLVDSEVPVDESGNPDAIESQEEGHGEEQDSGISTNVEVHVYKKRWYILAVFSLLGIYQVILMWNEHVTRD